MGADRRRSIAKPVSLRGVGLHTGATSALTFRPAGAGQGIVFRRTDLTAHPEVPALLEQVESAERRTAIGKGESAVQTVEHVLSAVAAHQIDDLLIDIDGPEPPAGDGSAAPFFGALAEAGVVSVGGDPTLYRISAPLSLREGDASYLLGPGDGLRLSVTIEWAHPAIGRQSGTYDITPEAFATDLARARTFGFLNEVEALKAQGLIKGGSPENSILLSETGVVGTKLIWPDEFVRHKTLDLLGDLALVGGRVQGHVVAFKPSHRGNLALARAIKSMLNTPRAAVMGIQEVLGIMPHRYPMLLVDRIIEIEQRKRIVGIKNVTINEPFFQGHFPGHPIMPGVLIVEAMAQVGGLLLMGAVEDPENKVVYFMSIDHVKFRRPVLPGDQIRFELEMLQFRGKTCRMRGVGYVDSQVVAEAEMMARVVDR